MLDYQLARLSDDPASLQTRVRPWYAEVRGIYSTNTAFGYVTITGLGIIRCRNNLYAPLGNDLSYVDVGTEALEEWRLCEPSESRWCFGFHNSCWRLLLLRLGHGQDDYFRNETAIAESVFYQLYCTPCLEASSFEFGHDYEGAAQTHKSFGRPKAVDLSSHFYADPCAIPSVDDLKTTTFGFCKAPGGSLWKGRDGARPTTATVVGIGYHNEGGNCASSPIGSNDNRHLLPFPDDMREDRCKRLGIPKHHFFDALSPELKYEIFSYLSFGELLNIRLVLTNYGRSATFAPLRSRLYASVELLPIFPPGNTITGFVALESANKHRFIRVGIQSQQCGEQPMIPDVVNHECHQIPDDQLRYDEKFTHFIDSSKPGNYQTYASLKNVRKIQASMGIRGRSRSSNRISGLKLEYYDHPSPSIVGQWMNELDDGFELSPDEKVQSLTIWLTPMGVVTFHSPGFHSLPPQKLQHQYQSDTGEELTAISWILNVSSDSVRAVISGNGSQRAQVIPEQHPPFDQVRKLYFETQNDDGCRETIVEAEAYFRDRAIIGLVFVYSSDRRASIGDFNVAARQTVHFARDAQIIGLSVAATEHELVEIEFEIEWNEQPRYEKLRLSIASPDDPANTLGYDWRDVWCRDGTSAESYQRLLARDRVYKPPKLSMSASVTELYSMFA
ncbi:hypothetical protein E8E15_000412 [Penicillium rubens]|nr:hypothetical protein E8E15_000412 [Penicillium rubens]